MNYIEVSYMCDESGDEDVLTTLEAGLADVDGIRILTEDRNEIVVDTGKYTGRYTYGTEDPLVPDGYDTFGLSIGAKPLTRDQAHVENALTVIKTVYELTEPKYVFGMHIGAREVVGLDVGEPVTAEDLADNRLTTPTTIMLFPPAMVDEYGRDWLLNLPAAHTEALDDGGVLVVGIDFPDCETRKEMSDRLYEAYERLEEAFDHRDL